MRDLPSSLHVLPLPTNLRGISADHDEKIVAKNKQPGRPPPAEAPAPEIFPLVAPSFKFFGEAGPLAFGWEQSTSAGSFALRKYRWRGATDVLQRWPLNEAGWKQAWQDLIAAHPELAEAVALVCGNYATRRVANQRRDEFRAELESEGQLGDVRGCVLLGGYGFDNDVAPGDYVDLYFTGLGLWVTKSDGTLRPYLRCSYDSARALEFTGGAIRTGGGYFGGGFGALGAVEGMAMASLLNALSTKTKIQTTIRFEAETAEVFCFTDSAPPRDLEIRLAEVRSRVRTHRTVTQIAPSDRPELSDRLLRLGEMLDKGQLSPEEFAAAKARLFEQP